MDTDVRPKEKTFGFGSSLKMYFHFYTKRVLDMTGSEGGNIWNNYMNTKNKSTSLYQPCIKVHFITWMNLINHKAAFLLTLISD